MTLLGRLARLCFAATLLAAAAGARTAELTVSAAASLGPPFRDIAAAFEKEHPGTRVRLNLAASGQLLQQIAQGAPVDVFASADEATMNEAGRQQLVVASTRVDFAGNALVVVVPADARVVPRRLADLRGDTFRRIAIGAPGSVPAGRYARAALEKAGLWAAIGARSVGAQSVRQALDYVARGEADAGFVYATDAASLSDKVRVAFSVPTDPPVVYPMAQVAASRSGDLARRFIASVAAAPGQAILARHGFAPR
ncbi:MAG: molybdate ABC transporter substrate-binding protein [Caldimonas sp.]